MCRNNLMVDTDVIKCLLDDLLDRICLMNSPPVVTLLPSILSSTFIENKFNRSINLLNQSLKQLLTYELNTVVENGHLTNPAVIRHGRSSNPTTTIKQTNDLRKRLQWIEQRQILVKQFHSNQQTTFDNNLLLSKCNFNSLENVWFDYQLNLLDNSMELTKRKEENEWEDNSTCSRCRIYQRQNVSDNSRLKKIKHLYRIHHEQQNSTIRCSSESDLIFSLSKLADQLGYHSNSTLSKTLPISSTTTNKKKQLAVPPPPTLPPKFQSTISFIVPDNNRTSKRNLEESTNGSNNQFIQTNSDVNNKRHKRIASPLSISSSICPIGSVGSSSPHEILTPTWRLLSNVEMDPSMKKDQYFDEQEDIEDISDEVYIRRHIRCELEQESWSTNSLSLTTNRKSVTFHPSFSAPTGLSTNTSKQYRYRLTPNGIAFTETIDTK